MEEVAHHPSPTSLEDIRRHSPSSENVRHLVQEEGRAARNLLVFNVLVDNKSPSSVLRSPRRQPAAAAPVVGVVAGVTGGAAVRAGRSPHGDERRSPRPSLVHARKRGRARSVSAGRGSAKDLHARYWSFLFENLRRAVDEIYHTCETDDSVLECKETIMILERCTQDFHNLIEWLKIKWEYEHTPKPQRPASVAWEIRKTSPGKLPLQLADKKLLGEQQSRKQLTFEGRGTVDVGTSTSDRHDGVDVAGVEAHAVGGAGDDTNGSVGRYLERALASTAPVRESVSQDKPVVKSVDHSRIPSLEEESYVSESRDIIPSVAEERSSSAKSSETPNSTSTAFSSVVTQSSPAATSRTDQQHERSDRERIQKSCTDPSVAQRSATEPDALVKSASADTDTGLKQSVRTRGGGMSAARQKSSRPAASQSTGKTPTTVSPRGGGTATAKSGPARGGSSSAVAGRGGRTDAKTAGKQTQSVSARGAVGTTPRGERAPVRRALATTAGAAGLGEPRSRPGTAPAPSQRGPPPVRSSGSGRQPPGRSQHAPATPARSALQRSATVCSERPPAPAQAYTSCIKSHSNSSLSSTASSSGHSWADRVRGIPPGSVARAAAAATGAVPAQTRAQSSVGGAVSQAASADTLVEASELPDDDGGGWETVKSRSKTRLSSLGRVVADKNPLQRKGSAEAACFLRPYSVRARFHQPTSAVSLPSLSRIAAGDESDDEPPPPAVPERRPVKAAVRRGSGRSGGDQRPRPAPPPVSRNFATEALRRSSEKVPSESPHLMSVSKRERHLGSQKPAAKTTGAEAKRTKSATDQRTHADVNRKQTIFKTPLKGSPESSAEIKASKSDKREKEGHSARIEPPKSPSVPAEADDSSRCIDNALKSSNGHEPRTDVASCPSDATLIDEPTHDTKLGGKTFTNDSESAGKLSNALYIDVSVSSQLKSADASVLSSPPGVPSSSHTAGVTSPRVRRDLASPASARDLTSPLTSRDLTSPELDDDSVDEEMVQAERALQSAIVEEQNLEQQLAETEKCVIEVDTETDGDSTSVDTECEGDGEEEPENLSQTIEEQYAPELESLSWGDRMDLLEELSSRAPGRGLQLHEKLSSPSRKKTLSETIRRHHERQQKAIRKRQTLMEQKTQKLRDISIKIAEVRQQKEKLLERQRQVLERKMARAEAKRRQHLQEVVRRAHDEEEKAKEIAFINEMEAKNKRHEFLSQIQTQELRLAGIQEERQRRVEEKAAKEAAVEEKRRALQEERRVKLEELKQRRQERLERIHREQQDKEKERLEMAREKQRDREERISALHAQQQADAEELQKRIQQKQEESARRHEESIGQIRQRALELSVRSAATGGDDAAAQLTPYDTKKMCTLCSVLIGSEVYLLSHLRGRQHGESVRAAAGSDLAGEELLLYNLRHITDASPQHILNSAVDKDRHKALRRRCKKIKARMVARQEEYSRGAQQKPAAVEAPHRAKLTKYVKELAKVAGSQGRGPWPNSAVAATDRTLGEIVRLLEKGVLADRAAFCAAGGLSTLSGILGTVHEDLERDVEIVPARTVGNLARALATACQDHPANCEHLIESNMVAPALDLLMSRLSRLSKCWAAKGGGTSCDPGAAALMQLTSTVLTALTRSDLTHQRWSQLQDVVSYVVCVGTVDKLASFFSCVQGGPDSDSDSQLTPFLVQSLRLVRAMVALLTARYPACSQRKDTLDRTGLIATLQVTQLVGVVSVLYSVLLRHHQPTQRGATPPPPLDAAALTLATEALATLLQTARLDLHMFQTCLGFEGRSVEFRHVTSYLLWYCSHHEHPDLLRLVIQTTGYFAVRCYDNQMVIQKGTMPTVLQQLLTLPFAYFSEPKLTAILYPTLLAISYDNAQTRVILQPELSFQMLEDFLKSEPGRSCHLVKVLLAQDDESGSVKSEATSVRSGSIASST